MENQESLPQPHAIGYRLPLEGAGPSAPREDQTRNLGFEIAKDAPTDVSRTREPASLHRRPREIGYRLPWRAPGPRRQGWIKLGTSASK